MPEDYSFNIPSPTQRLLGGIQQGLGIGNVLEQREQRNIKFEQQQEDRKTAAVRQKWDLLTKEKQTNQLRFGGKVIAALGSSPKFGVDMLKERAEAERNSGNEQEAAEYDRWAEIAEINPEGVRGAMTTLLATLPGGTKIIEGISKAGVEERKFELQPGILRKQAADLGLTKAQINKVMAGTKKLGIESRKAIMELEALEKGELSPEKKFDQEKKLRDEFAKKTADFTEGTRNYEVIKSSAADNSGAGDVALVTAFMKMLDPGSVVRETEFANARDTAGLLTQLKNAAQKVQTGQFLDSGQRKTFARLAKQYLNAAEKQQKEVKRDLGVVVKNYSLNEENVFGIEPEEEEVVIETVAPQQVGRFQIEVVQ